MKPSLEHLKESLRRQTGRKTIAVALSGGVDSLFLTWLLREAGVSLVALHFNHRWRGRDSLADERWVVRWCRERKIPVCVGRALAAGVTSEGEAREERLTFFAKECGKRHIREIWLAHHADDLVETFLMQLMRGAGPEGLAGLLPVRKHGKVILVRPLLGFFKRDLELAAREAGLDWREDHTNQKQDFVRNRVRQKLLPEMSRVAGRAVAPAILRAALLMAGENDYWKEILPRRWPAKAPVSELVGMHIAWQRRWLRGWLQSRKVSNLSYEVIEQVRELLKGGKPSQVNLAEDRHCRRRQGVLWVE